MAGVPHQSVSQKIVSKFSDIPINGAQLRHYIHMNTGKNLHKINIYYPKDKSSITLRITITMIVTLFITFLLIKNFDEICVESLALGFLVIAGIFDSLLRLHRLISYDEICVVDKNFIVKKDNIILSETPIDKIQVYSKTNPFNFFQTSWKRIYLDNKLLFHYETNEIESDDELLLAKIL